MLQGISIYLLSDFYLHFNDQFERLHVKYTLKEKYFLCDPQFPFHSQFYSYSSSFLMEKSF